MSARAAARALPAPAGLVLASALLLACAPAPPRPVEILQETGPIAYVAPDQEKPRIRYAGGDESANDRCVVRKAKLNLRMPPTWVNGRPIGFC